jgi:hypothetical protein
LLARITTHVGQMTFDEVTGGLPHSGATIMARDGVVTAWFERAE